MEGMKGAKATITGAYDTIAYTVTYKPTTGGEEVKKITNGLFRKKLKMLTKLL